MKKAIGVLGANGQLGSEFKVIAGLYPDFDFIFFTRNDFDFSMSNSLHNLFDSHKFDVVINCVAYTNVDQAEDECDLANQINGIAVEKLANICKTNNTLLVHFSTDYVFNGDAESPYSETVNIDPINKYGTSKALGELKIIESGCEYLTFRTSWLYSSFGNNFVKTMLRLGEEREEIGVVSDQNGSPTYAFDLASDVMKILEKIYFFDLKFESSIYHYSNAGATTWKNFAQEIFRVKNIDCKVNAILTKDYPTKAVRPLNSVLDNTKLNNNFDIYPRLWKEALLDCLEKIN